MLIQVLNQMINNDLKTIITLIFHHKRRLRDNLCLQKVLNFRLMRNIRTNYSIDSCYHFKYRFALLLNFLLQFQ